MATSVFIWPGISPGGNFSGQMVGPAADNTTAPPFTFLGDLTSGYASSTVGTLDLVTAGTSRLSLSSTAATFAAGVIGSFTKSAIATTSTTGLSLNNATAALVGTTVQISPRFLWSGFGWDSDDAVSRPVRFFAEALPVSANTVSGIWKVGYLDPITSAITYPLTLTSSGALTTLGSIAATGGTSDVTAGRDLNLGAGRYVAWASGSSSLLNAPANGDFQLSNSTATNKLNFNLGNSAQNGQALSLVNVLTELTTVAAAASTDTTIQMPAASVVLGVSVRVTTVIPTATSFSVGDSGSATRFSTGNVAVAQDSTDPGTKAGAYYNASALSVRLTMNGGTPAANTGRVRVTIYYYSVTPPTS